MPAKCQAVANYLDIDKSAVFSQMSPLARVLYSRASSSYILKKMGHMFWGMNVR
jgi:hypothetical protein